MLDRAGQWNCEKYMGKPEKGDIGTKKKTKPLKNAPKQRCARICTIKPPKKTPNQGLKPQNQSNEDRKPNAIAYSRTLP